MILYQDKSHSTRTSSGWNKALMRQQPEIFRSLVESWMDAGNLEKVDSWIDKEQIGSYVQAG